MVAEVHLKRVGFKTTKRMKIATLEPRCDRYTLNIYLQDLMKSIIRSCTFMLNSINCHEVRWKSAYTISQMFEMRFGS